MLHKKLKINILFLLFISFLFSGISITYANEQGICNRVLFISSYDYDWDSVPRQLDGFSKAIDGKAKVDYVFMDTKTHKYEDVKENIYNQIKGYIEDEGQYAAIVLGDDAAFDFAMEYRTQLFGETPMVFEGINSEEKAYNAALDPLITGVVESFPMEETIDFARQLYHDASKIVAITDDTESCAGSLKQFYEAKAQFPDLNYDILDCSKLTKTEIENKVSSYGSDTILLFLMMSRDLEGNYYSQYEAARLISSSANIPVFKADELGIGDGLLGGVVISYNVMGKLAGDMVDEIINGASPSDIDITIMPFDTVIDENVLHKFNINTDNIEGDFKIINHTSTFWEKYHLVLIPMLVLVFFLIIINVLVFFFNRKKKNLIEQAILYKGIITETPTGIYIFDNDNHDMLYVNDKVISDLNDPEFEGRKCYEYLLNRNTPCADCHKFSECKEGYLIREISVNGRHLILKGKMFKWGAINAHIEYVTDDTYRFNEQMEREAEYRLQIELMEKLREGCVRSSRINITNNEIDDSIVELSREQLLKSFSEGKKNLSVEHKMVLQDGRIHWCRTNISMMENPSTKDVEGYSYTEDINVEIIRKELMEMALKTNREMLVCIDAINNRHIAFVSSSENSMIISEDSSADIERRIKNECRKDECVSICRKFKIGNVISELENKDKYTFSIVVVKKGEEHYRRVSFSYLDRELQMIAMSITDITDIYTEHREQAEKLQKALVEAESANMAKIDFLARMSHDMRTPMNGILGLCEIMQQQKDISEIKKELPQLREAGEYLLRLINDVLDVNKMESGKIELQPKPCDEKKVFEGIISMMKPQMDEKSIDFTFETKNIQWTYMMLDVPRVKQIFINLLSNAVKFTPEGGKINFIMKLVSQDEHIIRDEFVIRDNGIGMSEEFLPRLFEPFAQENRVRQGLEGTGLGMAIVKRLVELMGGTISVKSKVNEGTEFTLYLNFPLADKPDDRVRKLVKDNLSKFLLGKRVLLCEDNPLNAQIAIYLLEHKGAVVIWRENGKLGVEELKSSQEGYYDVILMDIRMPIMDGIEATKTIRALDREDAKIIPIIAMTANAYEEDVQKSLSAGMNAHLAKPVNPDKMFETILKFIK